MYRIPRFAWLLCAPVLFAATPDPNGVQAHTALARLPLRFEENRGQATANARFLAHASNYQLELTPSGPSLALGGRRVDLRLRGSNPAPSIRGEKPMEAVTNYFTGTREHWRMGIRNYAQVRYQGVYPGIDAVYYGNQSQMEYDFVLAPGANPRLIRLQFRGADKVTVNKDGDLSVEAGGQPMLQKKPRVYQGSREVAARYVVHGNEASIELGSYDKSKELVIDPILVYCTYLGSSGTDQVNAVKMGPKGQLYLAGSTTTSEIPYIDGAYNNNSAGLTDIFIAIVDTTNSNYPLKYFSYFGGSALDIPNAMAVDGQGVLYLTGTTTSTDFPLAGNNVSTTGAGSFVSAFVMKFDPSQWGTDALLYSTYLNGTTGNNSGNGIAIDRQNKIYVIGTTNSTDFPVTTSGYAQVLYGSQDAFITKIDPDSSTPLVYSTYMGGELTDDGRAIAVDASGKVYFACSTISTQFPMEGPGYRQSLQGGIDLAIGVIDPNQFGEPSMSYSTYLGGSGLEEVRAMTLDANNNVVLTGYTLSTDFPTTPGALSRAPLGDGDVFVTVVNPNNPPQFLVYSTYFGGSQGDVAYGVDTDSSGNIIVTGYTLSPDLFTVAAPQPGWGGGTNVFVAKIKPGVAGRAGILFSTFFGQQGLYVSKGVAVGPDGSIYTAGYGSVGLPSSASGQGFFAGYDGFLIVVQ